MFVCAVLGTSVTAQTERWVAQFDGHGNGYDEAIEVAVDASGNVYVTGISEGVGHTTDCATVKYDSEGNQLWVARTVSVTPEDLAIDASGNVYVTGSDFTSENGADYATIKYDSAGNEVWIAYYNGPTNREDTPTALAVDASGNVHVTGSSFKAPTTIVGAADSDYATVKYDSAGNEQWVARYNGPGNGGNIAYDLAVDISGNVYVTGVSSGPVGPGDCGTVKYDSTGREQWVALYNGPGNSGDRANSLGIDASGSVYVTGSSYGQSTGYDYLTIKYDSEGNEQWVSRYSGPRDGGSDRAVALALDASGNVCVTGYSTGPDGITDYATLKYDSAGNEKWVARYNGPGSWDDRASDLGVDASGNVYVTGYSYTRSGGSSDYATVKYDPAGIQQGVARYNGPGNSYDYGTALALDASGSVYVTGYCYLGDNSENSYDYATIKYTPSNTLLSNLVLPELFTIQKGALIAGGRSELLSSDDLRMEIQARPANFLTDPNVRITVEGTAPPDLISKLTFRTETLTTGFPLSGVTFKIDLYNYGTVRWDTFEREASNTDTVVDLEITIDAERYIQAGTRKMRARLAWFGPSTLLPNWEAKIDRTVWFVFR